jgi:Ras family protein T1
LTPAFRDCLHRIFTLCDLDGDGALNDAEISAFNKRTFDEVEMCFVVPLLMLNKNKQDIPAKSLEHVKRVAKYQNASFVDANDSIKFEGFCFWITIFTEKQEVGNKERKVLVSCFVFQEDVPWQVLYEWGYNRYLELEDDYLFPENDYKFGREITEDDLLHPDPSIAEVGKREGLMVC